MHYQIGKNETLNEAVHRIFNEELEQTAQELSPPFKDLPVAIHNARKSFKKLRALVRLVRYTIGKELYQTVNYTLRDLGRHLSAKRDAHVLIETIHCLVNDAKTSRYEPMLNALHRLKSNHTEIDADFLKILEEISLDINDLKTTVHNLPDIPNTFESIRAGIIRVYEQGQSAQITAEDNQRSEYYHEWRKQAKYLWHQLQLLYPLWPEMMTVWADEVHKLSDYLSEEHDLAVFLDYADNHDYQKLYPQVMQTLSSRIKSRRRDLRKKAHALGCRVYAEDGKAFADRHGAYWKSLHRQTGKIKHPFYE